MPRKLKLDLPALKKDLREKMNKIAAVRDELESLRDDIDELESICSNAHENIESAIDELSTLV